MNIKNYFIESSKIIRNLSNFESKIIKIGKLIKKKK